MYCLCVILCVQLIKLTEDTYLFIYFYMIMGILQTLFLKNKYIRPIVWLGVLFIVKTPDYL